VIARIVLVASLALLAVAQGPALGEPAQPAQLELVEQAAPPAEEEAVATFAFALAASRARAACPQSSEEIASPGPALARIFRPPRRSIR